MNLLKFHKTMDANAPTRTVYPLNTETSVAQVLQERADIDGNKIAFTLKQAGRTEEISYAQLVRAVGGLVDFLQGLGLKRHDCLLIILDNRPEWAEIFFAAAFLGVTVVPLNPQSSIKEAQAIILDCGAICAFISDRYQQFYNILENIPAIKNIIVLDAALNRDKYRTFPDLGAAGKATKRIPVECGSDALMLILYTSGTTDLPKGVMLTHANLLANFNSIKQLNILRGDDAILGILPLYHSYPLMVTLIVPLFLGLRVVYLPENWPEFLAQYIKETGVSIVVGVPVIFTALHRRIFAKIKNAPWFLRGYVNLVLKTNCFPRRLLFPLQRSFGKKLRLLVCGGAKLDENVERDFQKLGFRLIQGYGLTEAAPVVTFNPVDAPRLGSVGRAVPGVEIEIKNKGADNTGEVAVRGLNVMKGYHRREEETIKCLQEGELFTGDLGYLDKDNYLYLTGRAKELIVLSSGKNIYPEELERHYSAMPFIKEICVLGVSKSGAFDIDDYLYAVVIPDWDYLRSRGEMNVREVIKNRLDNLAKELPDYKHLMGFVIVREPLPRTTLGKIKRYEVKRKYFRQIIAARFIADESEVTPTDRKLMEEEPGRAIVTYLKEDLGITFPLHPDQSIELDIGLDSLARTELLSALERIFAIKMPGTVIAIEIYTLRDLILKVSDALAQRGKAAAGGMEKKRLGWKDILLQLPRPELLKKIEIKPYPAGRIFNIWIKTTLFLFFKVFFRLKVRGIRQLPKDGPYIICSNHVSFFDGFLVAAALPYKEFTSTFFIGFKKYFEPGIVKRFSAKMRVIPVDASEIVPAMQASSFILRQNKILCVFPEGERSLDGKVKAFKKGAGILVKELQVPVVPVYIKGAYQAWPRTRIFPCLYPIEVFFGAPLGAAELEKKNQKSEAGDAYQLIAWSIQSNIAQMQASHG